MENRDFLSAEIRGLIGRLTRYEEALEADDPDRLMKLLAEGKACKTAVLKKCGPQQINGE